jgi:hypothetical protein
MSVLRKTSRDYKEELQDLRAKEKALDARIRKRCTEMIVQYPNISMGFIGSNAREKEIVTGDYRQIDKYSIDTIFMLMEIIEAHLASEHPHKQTTIKF